MRAVCRSAAGWQLICGYIITHTCDVSVGGDTAELFLIRRLQPVCWEEAAVLTRQDTFS